MKKIIITLFTLIAYTSSIVPGYATEPDQKKNVVLLLFDDLRYDSFGFKGAVVNTPNIDKLAKNGICFNSAITTTGLCSPSRAALFTGRWGHRTALDDNTRLWHSKNQGLSLEQTTLLEWSSQQGYKVGYFGKWHLGPLGPEERGIKYTSGGKIGGEGRKVYTPLRERAEIRDYYNSVNPGREKDLYYKTLKGTYKETGLKKKIDEGIHFISDTRNSDSPFFLTISFNQPHPAYKVPEPYASLFDPDKIELPASFSDNMLEKPLVQTQILWPWHDVGHMTKMDWKRTISYYYGAVAMIDRAVGEIVQSLKENGSYENTMILIVGDQGSMIGEHGLYDKGPYSYEELIRMPIIMKIPGKRPRMINRQVSVLDLNQTLAEWMEIEPGLPNLDSRSLFPLINGGDEAWQHKDDLAFYHYEWYNGSWFGIRTIRTPEWKYCWSPTDMDELYDLKEDPYEVQNLVQSEYHKEILFSLQKKLLLHLEETEDTLFDWFKYELEF
jgi:arylsulfatase A-like enzyme